ncbi:MAG TPA: NAD(+) synthase [Candidatus Solibacter sp.]|nr:NAD(+) synthase [Candidatus Solibacter sp.]
MKLTKDVLNLRPEEAFRQIDCALKEQVFRQLKRRGVVLGVSGGIDSSVVAALCARSLGIERVAVLLMPERESSNESLGLGKLLAETLKVKYIVEDITPLLEAAGCYRRRDDAIRAQIPDYGPGHRCKIVLSSSAGHKGFEFFHLVVESPSGHVKKVRLNADTYLGILAATNMKQRARKFFEYYHADRLNYAVAGTPNRLEYDQGFFVKNGDGAADLKPIAHLYKTQVYQLAEYLGVPEEIRKRPPTTDTYSMPQSQEEFYFSLPYEQMDLCLYGLDNGCTHEEVAGAAGLSAEQVKAVYSRIVTTRKATRYLHMKPLLMEEISLLAGD